MAASHAWTFFRAGGFDQVDLKTAKDLLNLEQLDQKLWVALACPTSGLEIDARTLTLVDTDKDGRVRVPELISAINFAGRNLKNPEDLLKGADALPLAAIDDGKPEGQALKAAARQILENLGKGKEKAITVADFAEPDRIFRDTAFNGDGVITEASASDEAAQALIREIADTFGTDLDRSGKLGVSGEKIAAFFAEIDAYAAWFAKGEADAARVLPLGLEKTTRAANAFAKMRAKVDDYFGRCRLAAFDGRATAQLNRREEEYVDIAAHELSLSADEVAGFPLSHVAPERPLPLGRGVNPAHAEALKALREDAITPLLGARDQLSETEWLALRERFAPYEAWQAGKAGVRVDKLGAERVLQIRSSKLKDQILELLARDKALESEASNIDNVERLVRYHRDLYLLCTNFVNFRDFYQGGEPAIFQSGTLYLDQRSCNLCMRVDDPAKHATMAGLAGAYLTYLECTRKASGEKMQLVAAITAGDSDNLMVGRNGLFYDRQGRDWDATITKIIDNPISLRQAFWSPYKKFTRFIEEQVAKRAAAADSEAETSLATTATATANADKTGTSAAPPAPKIDVGAVAAMGVAVGAIGTFFTAIIGYLTGILKLGLLATVGALIGVILAISAPALVLAYIKLRKRNLGPILDANGWAVNASARINVPFGTTLTGVARLPAGSRRDARDVYAEKGLPWKRWVFLVLVLYGAYNWYEGNLNRLLPKAVQPKSLLGELAPDPAPAPVAVPVPAASAASK